MHISTRSRLAAATGLTSPITTNDEWFNYDQATVDSTGAFLVSELDRLDNRAYEPLVSVTWSRDIDLRTDVTVSDESTSFLNTTMAATGGVRPNGKNWISRNSTAIPGVALDMGRIIHPLNLWGMELSFTLPELATAARLQRPIDRDKYDALQLKHQMDIDEQVYTGDIDFGVPGLVNNDALIPPMSVAPNKANATLWANKSPTEILGDINQLLTQVWTNSAYSFAPTHLLLPPIQFSYLVSELLSTAGSRSVIDYLAENSLSNKLNGKPLIIAPTKWLPQRGAGGLDRMVAYRKDSRMVRFPMTALQRTPVEYRSLYQITTYWGKLGQVEFPRTETIGYMDGI